MPHNRTAKDTTVQNSAPIVNRIELAKILGAWPIFGASQPAGDPAATITPPATPPADPAATTTTTPPADDPIAKLAADPAAITQLLQQVTQLQSAVEAASTENASYKQKEADAERAKLSEIDQYKTDVENLKKEVEKRDNVIRAKAIENAILENSEYKWNSTRQMMAELDMDKLDVQIDVDKGVATVKNMSEQLKTIAEKNSWLLKTEAVADPPPATPPANPRQRTSGTPPRPPAAPGDKDAKRREVMKRMPVLAGGRTRPM